PPVRPARRIRRPARGARGVRRATGVDAGARIGLATCRRNASRASSTRRKRARRARPRPAVEPDPAAVQKSISYMTIIVMVHNSIRQSGGGMEIVIAGAGIGGLTLALMLHQRGIGCRVYESAQALRPLGVGINLLPHAVNELDQLGLLQALSQL